MTAADFKAARLRLGHTQVELAAILGVNRASIIRWEAGTDPVPAMAALAIQAVKPNPKKK